MKLITTLLLITTAIIVCTGAYQLINSILENDGPMILVAGVLLSVGGICCIVEKKLRQI